MKRRALIAGALLLVGALGFGLDLAAGVRGSFGYGGFLGPAYPPYVNYYYLDPVFFPDWGAGVFVRLGDRFAVQLEALYQRLGGALRQDVVGQPYYTEYFRADYLAPTALLKLRYRQQSLFAGPVVMYRIGPGSYKYRYEDGSLAEADFADGELSRILFAGACGIDFQLHAGRGSLVLELRWLYSFTSFFTPHNPTWHPYAFLTSVGYIFPLRRRSP